MFPKSLMPKVDFKTKQYQTNLCDGVNQFGSPFNIADSEMSDALNISNRFYPAMSTRPGWEYLYSNKNNVKLTDGAGLGVFTDSAYGIEKLVVADNGVLKKWGGLTFDTITTLTSTSSGKFVNFSTGSANYLIFSNGTDRIAWDGTTVTNLTNAPNSRKFTAHKGRLFWCDDKTVKFSALNQINDYTAANDSGSITITTAKGPLFAIASYDNKIVAWSDSSMHVIYGTGPENFELYDISFSVGCIADLSVVTCSNKLYWITYDGTYEYDGTVPVKVSIPLTKHFQINDVFAATAAGTIDRYIYFSVPNDFLYNTIEYDTLLKKWYIRDDYYNFFGTYQTELVGINKDNYIVSILDYKRTTANDPESGISWYAITKAYTDETDNKKTVSELNCVLDLLVGSTLNIYFSPTPDNNDFELLYTFTANSDIQSQRILIPTTKMQNLDYYRFKFAGTGHCRIYSISRKVRIKPR